MPLSQHGLANEGVNGGVIQHIACDGLRVPTPKRSETMTCSGRLPDVAKKHASTPREGPLMTKDIDGACPTYRHKRWHVDHPAVKDPIPGTTPRTNYPEVRRIQDMSLRVDDIEKACPAKQVSKRCLNPLNPKYQLPSYRERTPTPPPVRMHEGSMRDSMEFTGKSRPKGLLRSTARDPNDISDIELSKPHARCRDQVPLTARDLWKLVERSEGPTTSKCHSARSTHPLDPEYFVSNRSSHPHSLAEELTPRPASRIGRVEGAAPRVLHRDNGEPQNSLVTADVVGAAPRRKKGSVVFSLYDPPEVTPVAFHTGLTCSDIQGTGPGTRKQGAWVTIGGRR